MKKTLIMVIFFFLFTGVACYSSALSVITASPMDNDLFPFGQNQGMAVQYLDSEHLIKLSLVDQNGEKKEISFPCERGNFWVMPSTKECPEFLIYKEDSNLLIWYSWRDDGLIQLRTWEGYATLNVKKEGLLLKRYGSTEKQKGEKSAFSNTISTVNELEFVDMRQQTILSLGIPQENVYFDDIIWDKNGWILLSRQATADNLYTIQRLTHEGKFEWKIDFPEVNNIDGFFSDGANGLWLTYSPAYAGDMFFQHIDENGIRDKMLRLSGERRVKYINCGQVLEAGKVVLYGTSVANSKHIYHVFALTLNDSGDILNLDVRNYTERKDYSIEIRQSTDGMVYVYSGNYGNTSPLLVPFSNLKSVENHGLVIYGN